MDFIKVLEVVRLVITLPVLPVLEVLQIVIPPVQVIVSFVWQTEIVLLVRADTIKIVEFVFNVIIQNVLPVVLQLIIVTQIVIQNVLLVILIGLV